MDFSGVINFSLNLMAIALLVFLNGFFVAAEFALVKVRTTQLDTLISKGHSRAKVARYILDNLNAFLSAAQLGITLASLGLGWIGEPVFTKVLEPILKWCQIQSPHLQHSISFFVGFSAITFLHIVVGEQAPKSLAIQKPLASALFVALPLKWFYHISYPFIWALNHSSLWLLQQAGIKPADEMEKHHSEEELKLIVSATHIQTPGAVFRHNLVLNALDLRHRVARDVMRPRHEIVGLNTEATIAECLDLAEKTRYSRFPLCEQGDIDRTIGIIHIKDLYALRLKSRTGRDLVAAARKIIYIPETANLEKVLHILQDRKLHLAIVVDEYGGTMGMVSLENILEELVGPIQDEFDQELPLIETVAPNEWIIAGSYPIHQLEILANQTLEEEGIATTSGLVTRRLGGFPQEGDKIQISEYELVVEELDGTRVSRLRLRRPSSK